MSKRRIDEEERQGCRRLVGELADSLEKTLKRTGIACQARIEFTTYNDWRGVFKWQVGRATIMVEEPSSVPEGDTSTLNERLIDELLPPADDEEHPDNITSIDDIPGVHICIENVWTKEDRAEISIYNVEPFARAFCREWAGEPKNYSGELEDLFALYLKRTGILGNLVGHLNEYTINLNRQEQAHDAPSSIN